MKRKAQMSGAMWPYVVGILVALVTLIFLLVITGQGEKILGNKITNLVKGMWGIG